MEKYITLRQFTPEELLFDKEETRLILKFIFNQIDHAFIDSISVNDAIRGFAQGLLLQAIDASYAIGFVEAIFMSSAKPANGTKKILKKFGKKALKHWFKHAMAKDLLSIKIYDFVRNEIARKFKSALHILGGTASSDKQKGAFLAYTKPQQTILKVWG